MEGKEGVLPFQKDIQGLMKQNEKGKGYTGTQTKQEVTGLILSKYLFDLDHGFHNISLLFGG